MKAIFKNRIIIKKQIAIILHMYIGDYQYSVSQKFKGVFVLAVLSIGQWITRLDSLFLWWSRDNFFKRLVKKLNHTRRDLRGDLYSFKKYIHFKIVEIYPSMINAIFVLIKMCLIFSNSYTVIQKKSSSGTWKCFTANSDWE